MPQNRWFTLGGPLEMRNDEDFVFLASSDAALETSSPVLFLGGMGFLFCQACGSANDLIDCE